MSSEIPVWQWGVVFLIVHIIIYGFYLLTSEGLANKTIYLQLRRYIPCSLAMTFMLYLWQISDLPAQILFGSIVIFLFWLLVYPLTYWIAFHKNTTFIDNHYDAAVGAYFFTVSLGLHILPRHFFENTSWLPFLLAFLQTAFLIIPIIGLLYFLNYRTPVSEAACMALLQTDSAEAKEYISQEIGIKGIIGIITLLALIFLFFLEAGTIDTTPSNLSLGQYLFFSILTLAAGTYSIKAFSRSGPIYAYREAKDYFDRFALFSKLHAAVAKTLDLKLPIETFDSPHTIIMVIGESASRYYMSAYRNTKNNTTPWMKEKSTEDDFILFRHAYTSWGQTVPALERALTEKNQYNDKDFNTSITLIDLARKAGYVTHWYSNQGVISTADTPVTLIGETADYHKWIQADVANTDEKLYDGDLLSCLNQVDSSKNNFIVFHIMGSHDNYINRYPKEFSRWGDPDKCQPIIDYDNSLAYTDWFLEKVFDFAKRNLNLQAMLYFSDHGANPQKKRNPDLSDFIFLRIPLFLYFSPEYQKLYPDTAATLRAH